MRVETLFDRLQAVKERYDAVIVDTAGRLQIDERMMGELKATQRAIKPSDTLLVVDAMTGQEAASLTKAFNEAAELTGVIPYRHTIQAFLVHQHGFRLHLLSLACISLCFILTILSHA